MTFERERCAKICDEITQLHRSMITKNLVSARGKLVQENIALNSEKFVRTIRSHDKTN